MESPWPHVKEYFARFPKSGFKLKEHTDLVVRSQSDEFYVHKAILAANSKFFANACKPGSPFKEAKTGIISFDDEDSRLIKVLLLSCYRELDWDDIRTLDDLTNENRNEMIRTVQDILNLVAIYRIADKYQVQYLMDETETWISGELVDDYNNDPINVYSNFHGYYKWQCPECGRENVVEGMNKPSDTKEQEMATESADQPMDDQL
ncbi:hypothetical protein IWZ00DRAFT_548051 [Phyllosticta capitalensis]